MSDPTPISPIPADWPAAGGEVIISCKPLGQRAPQCQPEVMAQGEFAMIRFLFIVCGLLFLSATANAAPTKAPASKAVPVTSKPAVKMPKPAAIGTVTQPEPAAPAGAVKVDTTAAAKKELANILNQHAQAIMNNNVDAIFSIYAPDYSTGIKTQDRDGKLRPYTTQDIREQLKKDIDNNKYKVNDMTFSIDSFALQDGKAVMVVASKQDREFGAVTHEISLGSLSQTWVKIGNEWKLQAEKRLSWKSTPFKKFVVDEINTKFGAKDAQLPPFKEKSDLIGKWKEVEREATWEFFKGGTASFVSYTQGVGKTSAGVDYKWLDDRHIRTSVPQGIEVLEIGVYQSFLLIKQPTGAFYIHERLK